MRLVSLGVCLLLAGLFSVPQTEKEKNRMSQSQNAVRFVKSENLPPSPGYSQAVDLRWMAPGRIRVC